MQVEAKSFRWLLEHKSWAQVELVVFPGVSLGMVEYLRFGSKLPLFPYNDGNFNPIEGV